MDDVLAIAQPPPPPPPFEAVASATIISAAGSSSPSRSFSPQQEGASSLSPPLPPPPPPAPSVPLFVAKRRQLREKYEEAVAQLKRAREERIKNLLETAKNTVATAAPSTTITPSWRLPSDDFLVDYLPPIRRMKERAASLCEQYLPLVYVPRVVQSFSDPIYNQRGFSGDEVVTNLKAALAQFPDPPTQFQWKLADATMGATAPLLYGDEYAKDPEYINERNGWRNNSDGVVGVLTGRKTGKSTGLAMIAIAYMFVIRGFRGVVASRTLEQAKIIVKTVQQLIKLHPWFKERGFRIGEMRATYASVIGPDGTARSIEARCGDGNVRSQNCLLSFSCRSSSVLHVHTTTTYIRTNRDMPDCDKDAWLSLRAWFSASRHYM